MSTSNGLVLDFKERLQQLQKEINSQEELISKNMKIFYGNKAKFIIFISFCDGKSRATVCKGIGNSIGTSWKNAFDIMNKKMKELKLNPIWVKADIVREIKAYIYEDFIKYVSKIKTNYFREGISFDPMFNIAFLEQEVNANVFIDGEKSKNKYLVWKNINFYIKNNLGKKYKVEEKNVKNIYTFKTTGFFHDGNQCYKLETEWLNNGRRYIEEINRKILKFIIKKSSNYLTDQVDSRGKFRYGYFPCFNKEIEGYNMLRHASTTYSMVEAYEVTKEPKLGQTIKLLLEHLVNEGIEFLKGVDGKKRAFVIERSKDNEIKLGGNAAAILALSKYSIVFNDYKYLPVMKELAEGIDYCHNRHDGSFVHVLNFPDLTIKEKYRIIYYDGEAAFALMRLYEIDKSEKWLNLVEQAFEYFIKNKYWNYHDHWLSYCSNELVKYKPEKKYFEFNLKNASGILDFCLIRETTYPTLLELLMATYNMVERMKKGNCFSEILATFDEHKLIRAIQHRVEHQLNGLFFPEVAMYFKVPENILWAFYIRHHSLRARIDDIEHNISGYYSYLSLFNP